VSVDDARHAIRRAVPIEDDDPVDLILLAAVLANADGWPVALAISSPESWRLRDLLSCLPAEASEDADRIFLRGGGWITLETVGIANWTRRYAAGTSFLRYDWPADEIPFEDRSRLLPAAKMGVTRILAAADATPLRPHLRDAEADRLSAAVELARHVSNGRSNTVYLRRIAPAFARAVAKLQQRITVEETACSIALELVFSQLLQTERELAEWLVRPDVVTRAWNVRELSEHTNRAKPRYNAGAVESLIGTLLERHGTALQPGYTYTATPTLREIAAAIGNVPQRKGRL
jgi:hypothetical protein